MAGTGATAYPSTFAEISTIADEVYRTVRPRFQLTIWHTIGKYEARAIAEIVDSQRFGDQYYATTITVGTAAPVTRYPALSYERTGVHGHTAGSRWSRKYWGPGSHPPPANIDHNIEYVRETKFTYYYDLDKALTASGRVSEITAHEELNPRYRDLHGISYYQPYMGDFGSRPEIGPYTRTATSALMCGDNANCWKLWEWAKRDSEQLATFRYHLRQGSPDPALVSSNPSDLGAQTRYLGRSGCTVLGDACDQLDVSQVSGLGRIFSSRAHPKAHLQSLIDKNRQSAFVAVPADRVVVRGQQHGTIQQMDSAHTYDHHTPIYALTGDPFFLEEAIMYAAFDSVHETGSTYTARGPDGSYGGAGGNGEHRSQGRRLIKKANTAFIIPDGLPEKNYFQQQIKEFVVSETDSREMTSIYSLACGLCTTGP